MKVAICISGHMRTFEKSYVSFYETLFNRYDCDVFLATYPTIGNNFSHIKKCRS